MTTPNDPARTVPRSYEERRRIAQDACREIPGAAAAHYPPCVFYPWERRRDEAKRILSKEDKSP